MKTFEEWWDDNDMMLAGIYVSEHPEYDAAKAAWNAATEAATPRWIPVSERLPDKDDKYLIKVNYYADFQTAWYDPRSGLFEVSDFDISSKEVTHWMAVPE